MSTMSFAEILSWAAIHRYPSLIVSEKERVSAGAEAWFAFLMNVSEGQLQRLGERIAWWNAKVGEFEYAGTASQS